MNISEEDFFLQRKPQNMTTNEGMVELLYHSESFGSEIFINER